MEGMKLEERRAKRNVTFYRGRISEFYERIDFREVAIGHGCIATSGTWR